MPLQIERIEAPKMWACIDGDNLVVHPGALPLLWISPDNVSYRLDSLNWHDLFNLGWRVVEHIDYRDTLDYNVFNVDEAIVTVKDDKVYYKWNYSFKPETAQVVLNRIDQEAIELMGILASPFAFEYYQTMKEAEGIISDFHQKNKPELWMVEQQYPLIVAAWIEDGRDISLYEFALSWELQYWRDYSKMAAVKKQRLNKKRRIKETKDPAEAYKIYLEPWNV